MVFVQSMQLASLTTTTISRPIFNQDAVSYRINQHGANSIN